MERQAKYSKNQGKPIGLKKAKAQRRRWKRGAKERNHPADSFKIPFDLLTKNLSHTECSAIKFCNGLDGKGKYTPVICAVDEFGEILSAFDQKGEITSSSFNACRENWSNEYPLSKGYPQFFFFGSDSIRENIENFDVGRYEAIFVEKDTGDPSALLLGYSASGMKDPGEEDEDPETALNWTGFCPPICETR